MNTPQLTLRLAKDLQINDDLEVTIKIADNSIEIKEDGLYASAPDGADGIVSEGYPTQDENGIRVQYVGIYDYVSVNNDKVNATNIIHHTYPAKFNNNILTLDMDYFRTEIDYILPGDILYTTESNGSHRYYIVTQKTNTDISPGDTTFIAQAM